MKRIFGPVLSWLGFLALAVGLGLAYGRSPSVGSMDRGLVRAFQVTYEVRLPSLPADANRLRIWVPLAASDRYQTIRRRTIQVPYPYQLTKDPEYGNGILFLDLRQPLPAHLDLSIQYDAEVRGERLEFNRSSSSKLTGKTGKLDLYLRSNRLMVVNDKVKKLADSITTHARSPVEEAQAIYRYVIERMTYEKKTPGWGKGDTLRACDVGTGNCTDFHSLFISLARARGIPARFLIGLPIPEEPSGEIPGYHCWAEVYLDGIGWVPVDASEAWKDRKKLDYFFGTYDPNRLSISTGRDIRLVPEPANGPVNIFFRPYVEVDGKSFDGVDMRFRFTDG